MRFLIFLILIGVIQPTATAADSDARQVLQKAIVSLAQQPSYSWTATTRNEDASAGVNQAPLLGQTQRDGYTYFKMAVGENTMEAAFYQGNSAIKTDEGWQAAVELDGDREWVARRLSAFQAPTVEAADLLGKVGRVRREKDGSYFADLNSKDAVELLWMRSRTPDSKGIRAKGWVRFWITSGRLSRYEYKLEGKVPGPDRKSVEVNRITNVEIRDVGTTRVDVPEEARKKL